jgi:hypothetical protein
MAAGICAKAVLEDRMSRSIGRAILRQAFMAASKTME